MKKRITNLKHEMHYELTVNILPFWMKMIDNDYGGFYGQMTGSGVLNRIADKGAILHARILWTFSSAYRIYKKEEYRACAIIAKRMLIDKFYDRKYGGIYTSLNFRGEPVDTKKQIYALGFAIYGLSEYYRATSDPEALEYAISLFYSIEKYSFDNIKNGYCEALARDWSQLDDMRLSEKDENDPKTMNTHLHILEPYTNLYRIWRNPRLGRQLRNLINIFMTNIPDRKTNHLRLFFDNDWNSKRDIISYGHDIEASWLIHEAAMVLRDKELLRRVEKVTIDLADAAMEGFRDNSMIYEYARDKAHIDEDRHWWVQAETVVGLMNMYQHFDDMLSFERAEKCWNYIKNNLIDSNNGEWFWSIKSDGSVNTTDDKAGYWKCPYHNGRMCMEILERFD